MDPSKSEEYSQVGDGQSQQQLSLPKSVVTKLIFFTLAMVIAPIGSFFIARGTIFEGNSVYAGITAAVVANIVLAGYVVTAFLEDTSPPSQKETKKTQ